jgi:hypothetical protein
LFKHEQKVETSQPPCRIWTRPLMQGDLSLMLKGVELQSYIRLLGKVKSRFNLLNSRAIMDNPLPLVTQSFPRLLRAYDN